MRIEKTCSILFILGSQSSLECMPAANYTAQNVIMPKTRVCSCVHEWMATSFSSKGVDLLEHEVGLWLGEAAHVG